MDGSVDLDQVLPDLPSPGERARFVASHPAAAAQFLHHVISSFLSCDLGFDSSTSSSTAEGGVFGYVRSYFGAVEEQGRGSLHVHMFIFLRGFPDYSLLQEKLASPDYQQRLSRFLNDIVCQQVPGQNYVAEEYDPYRRPPSRF